MAISTASFSARRRTGGLTLTLVGAALVAAGAGSAAVVATPLVAATLVASGFVPSLFPNAALNSAIKASMASSAASSSAIMPINSPTPSVSPSSNKTRFKTPVAVASKVFIILSDSISTSSSPLVTLSPTLLCQLVTVPFSISIPHFGIAKACIPELMLMSREWLWPRRLLWGCMQLLTQLQKALDYVVPSPV